MACLILFVEGRRDRVLHKSRENEPTTIYDAHNLHSSTHSLVFPLDLNFRRYDRIVLLLEHATDALMTHTSRERHDGSQYTSSSLSTRVTLTIRTIVFSFASLSFPATTACFLIREFLSPTVLISGNFRSPRSYPGIFIKPIVSPESAPSDRIASVFFFFIADKV